MTTTEQQKPGNNLSGVSKDDMLPWHDSQIKAEQKKPKEDKKAIEAARKEFLATATEEQMVMVALQHSNIMDVLKESNIIPANAAGFTMADVKKYMDSDFRMSKLVFYNPDMKPVEGGIERANGYVSSYNSSHITTAVRQVLVGNRIGEQGWTAEVIRDYASQMSLYAPTAQILIPQAANVGAEFQERLCVHQSEVVAEARKGLLDLPLTDFAAAFPSTVGHINTANEAYKTVENTLRDLKTELANKERDFNTAKRAEHTGELESFKQLLTDIQAAESAKGEGVADTALMKKIAELKSKVDAEDFVLEDAEKELIAAFNATLESQKIGESAETNEDGSVTVTPQYRSGPVLEFLKAATAQNTAHNKRCDDLQTARSNAEELYNTALTNYNTGQQTAADQIKEIHKDLMENLKAAGEADAANGDLSLKMTLESGRQVTQTVNGQQVTGTVYRMFTKEVAEYEANANVKAYKANLAKINGEVEAQIAELNDPMITSLLETAKAKEAALQAGDRSSVFATIPSEQLETHIKSLKEEALKDLEGQAKRDAEKAFKERETLIRQAAGYINFTYARVKYVDARGVEQISMTGAESMARAHYLNAQRAGDANREVLNGARVREYEALSVGRDHWRHELGIRGTGFAAKSYGAGVMDANYNARRSGGASALAAFDEVVSDNAGKAMADYTHGMRRIQRNGAGFIHRNATTEGVLQLGAFALGQYVGGLIFGRAGGAIAAGGNTTKY